MNKPSSIKGFVSTIVSLSFVALVPGCYFGFLWLAAHLFPESIGTYVYVDPKHPHPDSNLEGLIFASAAIGGLVVVPSGVIATLSWLVVLNRRDVSGALKIVLTLLLALAGAGTLWLANGMK